MLFFAGAALLLQVNITVNGPSRGRTVVRDSTATDTTAAARRAPKRLPVTAQLLATAWDATGTRDLYLRARKARLSNDSSLHNYDTKVVERLSVGMGLGSLGPDHLMYREESAARVRWQRGVGAWIDMTGAREVVPMISPDPDIDAWDASDNEMSPIPYFPGMEPFGLGGAVARPEVDDRDVVNPLGEGAEAYYTFERGDSLSMTIGQEATITIREIKFRPRAPKSNLAVGSLYFDTGSGQLVEAVYRLSVPMDVLESIAEDDPSTGTGMGVAKALVSPLDFQVTSVYIEYGLYEGNHWLPKVRTYEGKGDALFMKVPVKMEQSFKYASVNGPDTLPPIRVPQPAGRGGGPGAPGRNPNAMPAGLSPATAQHWRDSVAAARALARAALRDSIAKGIRQAGPGGEQCDTSQVRVIERYRYTVRLPVAIRMPCDVKQLLTSPDLPASIYDPGDKLFGSTQRDALVSRALSMSAQAAMTLTQIPKPSFKYGVAMTRYNRVEGLSTGLGVDQQIGGGYTVGALGRFGFADREPNAELAAARTDLATTLRVTAYTHLVSAGDWGNPLSFGSSLRALLFGRDEGFYYRATGAELTSTNEVGPHFTWRLFAEEERTAVQATTFSFGAPFPANLTATRGDFVGGSMRWNATRGEDPNGFQFISDLRLEAAGEHLMSADGSANDGDSAYGRAALDLRLSHTLGASVSASVSVSGGSSAGALPVQRRWYLGGLQTVRGESPDTAQSGNAFWLARAELGHGPPAFRMTVFSDLGWAGDRTKLADAGRPLSGVGTGLSMLDGFVRFDVARGLYPRQEWRVDLYLEGRY